MTEVARHSSGALRQRVVSSAAVFARRHLRRQGLAALPPLPLALACLFLAAKVEESHVSARYLLRCAERASAEGFCSSSSSRSSRGGAGTGEETKKGGGGGGRGGNSASSISLVASSSSCAFQRENRNDHAAAPSSLKKPAAAAAAAATAAAPFSNYSCPLPPPTPRQLLEAEVELVSSLGARGLLIWSPYPDALEAAAAIEQERERKIREETAAASSSRKQKQLQRLGARAWAAVSVSLSRTDVCLWAPPHVIGFAAAAVAAAAADEAERVMTEEEEEEEAGEDGDGGEEARGRESRSSSSSSSPSSFTAAATRWFSSLDVDLDAVAEVAAELCYAAGVERASRAGRDEKRRRMGENSGSGGDGDGGRSAAHQRADAAARVFEFLRRSG